MKIGFLIIINLVYLNLYSQTYFLKSCIEGDWIKNYNYGCVSEPYFYLKDLKDLKDFEIISFNTKNNTFKIRKGNKIIKTGIFKIVVRLDSAVKYENVLIDLRKKKDKPIDIIRDTDFMIFTNRMELASYEYFTVEADNYCDFYYLLGKGFFNMELSKKNIRLINNMITNNHRNWNFQTEKVKKKQRARKKQAKKKKRAILIENLPFYILKLQFLKIKRRKQH